jgi:ABC-type phosphate transport system auxiliary subunit
MRGVIKGALAEELENSLRMKKEYEEALSRLPKGCLAIRKIRGHEYYYLVKRIGEKVKYIYKGKISEEEKKKYQEAKELRAKYKKLLAQVKKQIRFLRSSLRGKEAI